MSQSDLVQRAAKLKSLLEQSYNWPTYYLFKFIVPRDSEVDLKFVFEGVENCKIDIRESKNGAYLSFSINVLMKHPDEVIEVYQKVEKVKGLMSL